MHHRVEMFSQSGDYLGEWGANNGSVPRCVASDLNGTVYVGDVPSIKVFSSGVIAT